jgi:hypothetical protein
MDNTNNGEETMTDAIKGHDVYHSCLENVLESRGYASDHANSAGRPDAPSEEWPSIEAEAVAQAAGQLDAGECSCCANLRGQA